MKYLLLFVCFCLQGVGAVEEFLQEVEAKSSFYLAAVISDTALDYAGNKGYRVNSSGFNLQMFLQEKGCACVLMHAGLDEKAGVLGLRDLEKFEKDTERKVCLSLVTDLALVPGAETLQGAAKIFEKEEMCSILDHANLWTHQECAKWKISV